MPIFETRLSPMDMETLLGRLDALEQQNNSLQAQIQALAEQNASQAIKINELISGLHAELKRLPDRLREGGKTPAPGKKHVVIDMGSQASGPATPPPPPVSKRVLYCRGESATLVSEVPENYAAMVPFVIEAAGEKGKARFNAKSAAFCAEQPESQLEPFFDCEKRSTSPSSVLSDDAVDASFNGAEWVLARPIRITLI